MTGNSEIISMAAGMVVKAAVLAARWAGAVRRRALEENSTMSVYEKDKRLLFLEDRLRQVEDRLAIFETQARKKTGKPRYSIKERLLVVFHMEYFKVPRRRVKEHFCIARSTLYGWLHKIDDPPPEKRFAWNKTPDEIAALVWEIAEANPYWGKGKIANQLALLRVFISASTVRNILFRPRPSEAVAFIPDGKLVETIESERSDGKPIPAFYPNHVWSVDLTEVYCWGLWKTYVLVAIDHFSRKVLAVPPLEGPNAAWTIDALEDAFRKFGHPKHMICDQQGNFTNDAFRKFLISWGIKVRYGAVGMHGSICVTERVIETFKYEWLRRMILLRGFVHLESVCSGFVEWYNEWRPHMKLCGFRPDDCYCRDIPEPVPHDAKTVPLNIERKVFEETGIVGFRLPKAA